MKAISLWQPWASAVALGFKVIETRHWSTTYRGPLAIHAAKRWTAAEQEFLDELRLDDCLGLPNRVPLGALLCVTSLVDCTPTERLKPTPIEERLGNYAPGRFGWVFENVRALPKPISYRGAQGLFEVPDDLVRQAA